MYKYLHIYTHVHTHTHKLYSLVFWHSHLLMWVCVCVCVYTYTWASQVALAIKNPPANCRRCKNHVFSPWVGKIPLEESTATHSSLLAQRIPWTEETGGLQSIGSQWARHNWSNFACIYIHSYTYVCVCVCIKRERERWREWEQVHCDAYVPLGFIPIPKIHKSRVESRRYLMVYIQRFYILKTSLLFKKWS